MRVVGGELRGRGLLAPASPATRPTSDRVRETVFDILAHRFGDPVPGSRVLDLFAGTGALGLESLSRGASFCLFVDDAASARGIIRGNVEALGLTGRAKIFRRDATSLGAIGTMKPFDLVFADPPYGDGLGEASLAAAMNGGWTARKALIVLEESAATDVAMLAGIDVLDQRIIGGTRIAFGRVAD